MGWVVVDGRVVEGHGVASGQGQDGRFPEGTLATQAPIFHEAGIDLAVYHPGTINVSIRSHRLAPCRRFKTVRAVVWYDGFPTEDFAFFQCRVGDVRLALRDEEWTFEPGASAPPAGEQSAGGPSAGP